MAKRIKISIYASAEEHEKIRAHAEKYNVSISSMATTLIKLGSLAFDLAIDPKMAKIYEKKFKEVIDDTDL